MMEKTAILATVLSVLATAVANDGSAGQVPYSLLGASSCRLQTPIWSCENTTKIVDTCCSPVQGLVLATQFWDTYTGREKQGSYLPDNSWTIHGLWPDRCDGSYDQYCDQSRQFDPSPPDAYTKWDGGDVVTPLLQKAGLNHTLSYINKHWKALNDPDWTLWQHEYSKHATCFSTFDKNCYPPTDNTTEASIIEYVNSVVNAFKRYPTYTWLEDAGITPSNQTSYSLDKITSALKKRSGAVPYLGCSGTGKNVLTEVWYFSHTLGPVQNEQFKVLDSTTNSSCSSSEGIWYYERTKF